MGNASSTPHSGGTPQQQQSAAAAAAEQLAPSPAAAAAATASGGGPLPKEPTAPPSPAPPQTPLLLPYAGHLSPQNPHALSHPQAHDYSKTVVTQLILDQQLAPFYRGLDDFEEDWGLDNILSALTESREHDYTEGVANSYTHRLKEQREGGKMYGSADERAEHDRRETKAYLGAVECPICFLNYPPNINTSRCCQQPLCTECFVQIKRGEATVTHIESEAACCPFCVESDFGVIYERPTPAPPTPVNGPPSAAASSSAIHLASSPDAGISGFSQALSLSDEPASSGNGSTSPAPPVPPKETVRRKSVSSKAKEVVTIDQIRPDWEAKLNAVKAAAARRAARRIVMRQVGDRLIPIGYTSSRATGLADFSMSIPDESRRARRARGREREMEEMMLMEAMRLSLLDHEEHQRKTEEEERRKKEKEAKEAAKEAKKQEKAQAQAAHAQAQQAARSGTGNSTPSSSRRSSSAGQTLGSWRAASTSNEGGRAQAAASKLLSKLGNRSRANSKSSVHFSPSPPIVVGEGSSWPSNEAQGRARSSSTPSPMPREPTEHHTSPLAHEAPEHRPVRLDSPPQQDVVVPVPVPGVSGPSVVSADPSSSSPTEDGAKVTEYHSTATPTAANPHPDLALLMGEALEDERHSTSSDLPPVAPAPAIAPAQHPTIGIFGNSIVDSPAVELRGNPLDDNVTPRNPSGPLPSFTTDFAPAPMPTGATLSAPRDLSPAAVSTATAERSSAGGGSARASLGDSSGEGVGMGIGQFTPERLASVSSLATSTASISTSADGGSVLLDAAHRPAVPLSALENDE